MRLKANHPTLYAGMKLLFEEPPHAPKTARCMRKRSGEIHRWRLSVSSALNEWADWPTLRAGGQAGAHLDRQRAGQIGDELPH